jgi:hypothetical protein
VRSPRTVAPLTEDRVRQLGTFEQLAHAFESSGEISPYTSGSELLDRGPGGPGDALMPGGIGDGLGGPVGMHSAGHGTCREGQRCGDGTIDQGGFDTGPGDHGVHEGVLHSPTHTDRAPQIRPIPGTTMGSLSREQVRAVVARHRAEVRFCYEQALVSRPDLEGRISVQFQVAPDGHVATSGVREASDGTERVASCVGQAVSRWTFPSSVGPTAVSYPFLLDAQ